MKTQFLIEAELLGEVNVAEDGTERFSTGKVIEQDEWDRPLRPDWVAARRYIEELRRKAGR